MQLQEILQEAEQVVTKVVLFKMMVMMTCTARFTKYIRSTMVSAEPSAC